jgi:hypothetical protein
LAFYLLKIDIFGVLNLSNFPILAQLKIRSVGDFSGPFLTFFGPKVTYTDLSKNMPHKKHCAWAPTPPPGKNIKFIDF